MEGSSFELVSSQSDFVNEVTFLQYLTEQRLLRAGCQLMLIRSPERVLNMTGVLPINGIAV
jgi:hypothetical protein